MNRSTRTLVVLLVAVGLASAATLLVYKVLKSRPAPQAQVTMTDVVVAAHALPVGTRLTASDVRVVQLPSAAAVAGGFTKPEEVVDRGVIVPLAENEPLTGAKVASKESGAGLPPMIPPGMRAISVKVNEVIGVAGFVVPGTRVDVMAIIRQAGGNNVARVVVSNVQVLASGPSLDQEAGKEGKPMQSSVVTLLTNPDDAERIGLASTEGQVLLTLRNPLDTAPTESVGTRTNNLAGEAVRAAEPPKAAAAPPRARKVVEAPPPPPPPPAPKPYTVEVIRGAKRSTQEIIK